MVDLKKEKEPITRVERVSVADEKVTVEVPRSTEDKAKESLEVQSWIEKIEKRFARIPNQTSDVTDDTVVIQQPQAQQPPVTLPVTQQQMYAGKKAKIDTGLSWLVTWAIRQIKMLSKIGRKVKLQDMPEAK